MFAISTTTFGQSAFEYLRQALAKTVLVSGLQLGYEYKDGLCLAGVLLENGRSTSLGLNFESGTSYRIIGVADEDVLDLDLFIEDSQGRVIVQDTQQDNLPIVDYTPLYSGKLTIRIRNYKSNGLSFCIIVVLSQKTYMSFSPPSYKLLAQALDNAVTLSELYDAFTGTTFVRNTFCLFGGVYNSGESDGIINFQVPSGLGGRYVFLGAGSNNVTDVDLKVIQQSNLGEIDGYTIVKDEKEDVSTAIVSCDLWSRHYYYMRYTNYRSSSKAFVFGVVMKESY